MLRSILCAGALWLGGGGGGGGDRVFGALPAVCDRACLARSPTPIAPPMSRDQKLAPFAAKVRFSENNVELRFSPALAGTP